MFLCWCKYVNISVSKLKSQFSELRGGDALLSSFQMHYYKTRLEKCHNVAVGSEPTRESRAHANYCLSVCLYFIDCHFTQPVLTFFKWWDSGWYKLNWLLLSSLSYSLCVGLFSVSHVVVSPQVRHVIFLEECFNTPFSKGEGGIFTYSGVL